MLNLLQPLTGENFHNVALNFCCILSCSTMKFLMNIATSEILIGLKLSLYTTPFKQIRFAIDYLKSNFDIFRNYT